LRPACACFFYLEDRERTLDSPIEKVMLSIQTMADEMEREKARRRMVDTMMRKAKAGHVTGGKCFGYANVVVYAGVDAQGRPRHSHVEHRIVESEAVVVRRIFELAASGVGQSAIAKRLNADGVLAPCSQQGRPRAWVQSSVHAVLFRERYKGLVIWNKTQKRDRWGRVRPTDRTAAEWIAVEAPQLAIVTADDWDAAHTAITRARLRTKVKARTGRGGRPSKYLLPGLARCGCCNGGIHVRTRAKASGRLPFYACTSHYNRGPSVCGNQLQVPMREVDRAVLAAVADILTPAVIDAVIASVREQLEPAARPDPRDRVHVELQALE
jgi:site-specific DNA recombinase